MAIAQALRPLLAICVTGFSPIVEVVGIFTEIEL